jgi:hypothetical protein
MEARQLDTAGRRLPPTDRRPGHDSDAGDGAGLDAQRAADPRPGADGPRIVLRAGTQQVVCDGASMQELRIGRAPDCDLVLDARFVSRCHARIDYRHHFFVLTDESSNGTYWRSEDGRLDFIHRQSVRLWGNGELYLGEPRSAQGTIGFQIRDC